jgi:polyisoprenoid-binding protein YceI
MVHPTRDLRVKIIRFLVGLFFLLGFPAASATDWQSDPANSHLYFAPSYEGMPINGAFKQFSTTYQTDSQGQPDNLRVNIAITSADLGNSDLNKAIGAIDWFNISDFPQAQFISEEFSYGDEGIFLAKGTLQLKGFKKTITVPFRWQALSQDSASMTGELILSRNDFFIGTGEWASGEQIGLAVKVWFEVVFTRSKTDL